MNESWDLPWQNWAFTIRNGKIHGKHIGTLPNKTEAQLVVDFKTLLFSTILEMNDWLRWRAYSLAWLRTTAWFHYWYSLNHHFARYQNSWFATRIRSLTKWNGETFAVYKAVVNGKWVGSMNKEIWPPDEHLPSMHMVPQVWRWLAYKNRNRGISGTY